MLSKKKPQDRVDPEYLVGLDTASAQPAPTGVKPFIQKHWKPITAADTYTVKPMVKGTVLTADFEVGDMASSVEKAQLSLDQAQKQLRRRRGCPVHPQLCPWHSPFPEGQGGLRRLCRAGGGRRPG